MKMWELLDRPEKWIKNNYAQNEDNHVVALDSQEACKWCLFGGIRRVYDYGTEACKVISKIEKRIAPADHIIQWNDAPERTWEEVHALLKELDI